MSLYFIVCYSKAHGVQLIRDLTETEALMLMDGIEEASSGLTAMWRVLQQD